uniref:Endonuclease/exonuclease/phosphatase domain-containing protein n=1 Tax=Oreochromis niloticus TaxID=8128 RepID=A0A669D7Z6_ORENI
MNQVILFLSLTPSLWALLMGVSYIPDRQTDVSSAKDIIPGRLILVDCHYGGQKFRLINVCTAPERTKKMQLLKKMRHLLECGFNTVLCGDFNMVTEENDRIASTTFKESREEFIYLLKFQL